MKRLLILFSALVLFFLLCLGYLAALGASFSDQGSPASGRADAARLAPLESASAALRDRYGRADSESEKEFIRSVSAYVDRASADAFGQYFARRNIATGLLAFIALAAATALSTLACLWLITYRSIVAPIARLAKNLDVDPSAVMPQRLPERGVAEIRSLYASFNALCAKLEEYREKVRAAERETIGRYIVHEIKNLLTPIPLALGALKGAFDGMPDAEAHDDAVAIIETQAKDIGALVDRFRQTYRFPAMNKTPCRLSALVSALPQVADGRVSILIVEDSVIEADLRFLSQAVGNLIANAFEACAEKQGNGTVSVELGRKQDMATIAVRDTGKGMSGKTRERVFAEWFTTKQNGMGLGLPFALRVAQAHGGIIEVESQEGTGTVCTMSLGAARP